KEARISRSSLRAIAEHWQTEQEGAALRAGPLQIEAAAHSVRQLPTEMEAEAGAGSPAARAAAGDAAEAAEEDAVVLRGDTGTGVADPDRHHLRLLIPVQGYGAALRRILGAIVEQDDQDLAQPLGIGQRGQRRHAPQLDALAGVGGGDDLRCLSRQ